ncbi:ATP-dependent DNA helicase RecG [Bosea sp. 62]|nr:MULTISPECIES: ATP-dependent DNA helicase RecG [unclassified Bosea (in: a-proteobacteria)]CAD5259352.1 ATP-dependent DNA helicase RecG [Bosea sp. 46]CAD5263774.1 ATP-dependent DNA helicase RecG [Bosea sp. 21B]VXC06710.1 ATP-dependent DNA helicase RecG [Bosea sp. 125]CAD5276511.1 ATP-dependent DNA helicase RecG [Bosea sp. 7B]VVT59032.1 ATP-dependent DNA helicase RecG [Bosea sp. EC-HK365B]
MKPLRPSLLDPLFAPATTLAGVGPKLAKALDKLLGDETHAARVIDLLFHLPTGAIDRRPSESIIEAPVGEVATFSAQVTEHRPAPPTKAKAPYRVIVEDETGDVTLVFFHADVRHLLQSLPIGAYRIISGKLELWDGMRQMVHPDRILDPKLAATLPSVEPVYGLTEGIGGRVMARIAAGAAERCPELPEWQDEAFAARNDFVPFRDAIHALHHPVDLKAATGETVARRRIAYDELLASQIALALVRRQQKKAAGRATAGDGVLRHAIETALPFTLTDGQRKAIADIHDDMEKPERMLRLLQGDVGSGKTVVALMAMAAAAEARRQSVLMAPTEILARQHAERLAPLADKAGLKLALLTGREKGAGRRQVLEGLANGEIDIVVGTHALFQEGVAFHDLALAVVDEQHRFGVHQRLLLGAKGEAVDILVMTATPIPRTLALTWFGDMDVSILSEKPAGRKPITTRAISLERYDEVVGAVGRALESGAQVYWVCPLVQESDTLDVAAAQERFEALQALFGDKVGLLHGQMPGRDKDAAMAAFSGGQTRVLVSTTVIEVGVDVPNASVMVIEHAERFGLAQLHQLRGRIGRGSAASTCLLLYKGPLGQVAEARLTIMRESEDGFRIAEEDLRLRGEGEVLGTRQSGSPDWRIARPEVDGDLLAAARDDARLLIERDPHLESERGKAVRTLLYLFERDVAIRLLRAG